MIETYLTTYFNVLKTRNYSVLTLQSYELTLTEFLTTHPFEYDNQKNQWECDLLAYRLHIQSHKKTTIARKISTIRSFIRFLRDEGLKVKLRHDDMIKIPKLLPKPLKTSFIQQALKQSNQQESLMILLTYGLGLRIHELAQLKWSHIHGEWVHVKGKGNKTRSLPLLHVLQKALCDYKNIFHSRDYIFETPQNQPMGEMRLRYKMQKSFKRLGFSMTPHRLRHSFATDMLNHGASINEVSELLGHQQLSTTQIYTKLANKTKETQYYQAHPLGNYHVVG